MLLVDTSVWVDHFRRGNAGLRQQLEDGNVACHPFVIGELACGSLQNRAEILSLMARLPKAETADHDEVLQFVEQFQLMSRGVGWIDMHLLASAALSDLRIWTLDGRMGKAAEIVDMRHLPE